MCDTMPTLRNELGKIDHLNRNLPSCGGGLLLKKFPTENRWAINSARTAKNTLKMDCVTELVKICILCSGIEDVFTWSIPAWKLIQAR